MRENEWDAYLGIHTTGDQLGFNNSFHYHRYEATPYNALEQLFDRYSLKSSDRLVDFGCGKGRLNFMVYHLFKAFVIGIEMNELFYDQAMENKKQYVSEHRSSFEKIEFECCYAQEYKITPADNRFYFFNPFSIQIFMKVINHILRSVEEYPREVELILYYGSEDYIFFLENQTSFELKEEIRLENLYEHNPYEKFSIYRLVY